MHTAIKCTCDNVIVYDIRLVVFNCPKCKRRWMQAPELFDDTGKTAERLPYLCAEYANNPIDDCMLGAIAESMRRGVGKWWFQELGDTFSVVTIDGKWAEVPTNLKDFAPINSYKMPENTP